MSKPFSLRDKQIREILDYDQNINRKTYNQELRWVKQYNETYLAPNVQEQAVAFQIEQYFVKLRNAMDAVKDNYFSTRAEQPVRDIVKEYQLLIAYLNQYVQRNPLNQRDWSIIQDKFDLLTESINEIATIAEINRWKGAAPMRTLAKLFEYRNYIPLTDASLSPLPTSQNFAPHQQPAVEVDKPLIPPRGIEMQTQTEMPQGRELKAYIDGLSTDAIRKALAIAPSGFDILAKLDEIKMSNKKAKLKDEIKKNKEWSQVVFEASSPSPIKSKRQEAAQPAETAMSYQDFRRAQQLRDERQIDRQAKEMGAAVENWEDIDVPVGQGRKKGTKYGGTNEGFLGGQPGGFRTALAYKPSDSAPIVIHKPLSYNDEVDVSLPMKMQFLNMTDTHRLYDDDEPVVNSQSQYKKLKKRLAKQKD